MSDKEFYTDRIVSMLDSISSIADIQFIYGATLGAYRDAVKQSNTESEGMSHEI